MRSMRTGMEVAGLEEPEPVLESAPPQRLIYEANPKHKPLPTPGRHGSICPPSTNGPALLAESDLHGKKRYATDGERAYCAQQHQTGRWHGYPVDWEEVPPSLVSQWVTQDRIDRRIIRRARRVRGR